jgi:hypothetical protein
MGVRPLSRVKLMLWVRSVTIGFVKDSCAKRAPQSWIFPNSYVFPMCCSIFTDPVDGLTAIKWSK